MLCSCIIVSFRVYYTFSNPTHQRGNIMQRNANFAGVPLRNVPEDYLLSKNKLARILRVSPKTITKLVAKPGFPAPVVLGTFPTWRSGAVLEYLDGQGGWK